MLALLHGYLLDGSGSNLWTQSVARSLCRNGLDFHLVCQEPHPEVYDFVSRAVVYREGSTEPTLVFERDTPFPGSCTLHRPEIGDTLPVYVSDHYEHFERVVPMVELPDEEIEAYVARNTAVVEALVRREGVRALHANHAVLMSVVARRVSESVGIPFTIMPHGSALEYAVKPDPRLRAMAEDAFAHAGAVFVIGQEMVRRLGEVFTDVPGLADRMAPLPLGVDVDLFRVATGAERANGCEELCDALAGIERGRTTDIARTTNGQIEALGLEDDPAPVWEAADSYPGKLPDEGVEDRLRSLDWEHDDVILYVGRLIAAKGIQGVVAALPEILRSRLFARLVVVGHGPLREPLESMVQALQSGDMARVRWILGAARRLEDAHETGGLGALLAWYDTLEREGRLDAYLESAVTHRVAERVVFTGYLTHEHLHHVYSMADVAFFPSMVLEAGPLVFLEAMASGAFPLGTDFGGTAVSIENAARVLPPGVGDRMKLRTPDAADGGMIEDIARNVVASLEDRTSYSGPMRALIEREHDWRAIARKLVEVMEGLA